MLAESPEPDAAAIESQVVGRGMAFAAASFVTSVVLSLGSSVVTSRVYGIRVIGEYALVSAPWVMVTQLSTVSEQVELVRRISRLPERDPEISGLFGVVLGFSASLTIAVSIIVMAVTVAVFRGPLHRPGLVLPALAIVAGYAFIDNTSWNMDMVLSAFRRGHDLFIARTTQLLVFLALGVGLTVVTRSVWGLTLATVGGFVCAFVVRLVRVPAVMMLRPPRGEVRRALPQLPAMLKFGLKLLPGIVIGGFSTQIGVWVLGGVAGDAEVGAFSRALGLSTKLQEAGYRVCEILFPTLVRAHDRVDGQGFADVLERAFRLTAVPLGLATAIGGGIATQLLRVFGPGFDRAANTLTILLASYSLSVLTSILGQPIIAVGRAWTTTITSVVSGVALIVTVYPFARIGGASGVAASILLSYVILIMARIWVVRQQIVDRTVETRLVVTTVKVSVVTTGALLAARAVAARLHGYGGAAVAGLADLGVFLVLVLATRLVHASEWEAVRSRLPGPFGRGSGTSGSTSAPPA